MLNSDAGIPFNTEVPINQPKNTPPRYAEIEDREIDFTNFPRPIGQGSFSDVFCGIWKQEEVAVKRFRYTQNIAKDSLKTLERRLKTELGTWKRAESHPNIVPFIGIYKEDPFPALVSPYLPDRDIAYFLEKHEDKTQGLRRILSLHIIQGVDHLHRFKVIHGDLKPRNVLIRRDEVNGTLIAQITDFGRARIGDEAGFTGSLHTTPRYTAPEIFQPEGNNHLLTLPSDVYSLGVTILEILSDKPPYQSHRLEYVLVNFLSQSARDHPGTGGPKFDEHNSNQYPMEWVWDLLKKCWIFGDPLKRISANDCLSTYKELIKEELGLPNGDVASLSS